MMQLSRRTFLGTLAVASAGLLSACGSGSGSDGKLLRLGYFPNVTHAPALAGDSEGLFTSRLDEVGGTVTTQSFNAGPDVIQALLGGSLDISYIGPNPTITAYTQSEGQAVRVIAGSTSGGAALVVKPEITSPAQLAGRTLATPQLGNTQDVALRYWLSTQNLTSSVDGGGDVTIQPQKNSAAVQAFKAGSLDGAWLPEPFATQLVRAGGTVLVDERTLWPDGKFVTTNIVVRTEFLEQQPALVTAFLKAHLDALDFIAAEPAKAQQDVAAQIKSITEQDVDTDALAAAWGNLTFTPDPLAASLKGSAEHAEAVGLLEAKPADDFAGLWDLELLNAELTARGKENVSA